MTPAQNKNFLSRSSSIFINELEWFHQEEIDLMKKLLKNNPYDRDVQKEIAHHKECVRNIKAEIKRR